MIIDTDKASGTVYVGERARDLVIRDAAKIGVKLEFMTGGEKNASSAISTISSKGSRAFRDSIRGARR